MHIDRVEVEVEPMSGIEEPQSITPPERMATYDTAWWYVTVRIVFCIPSNSGAELRICSREERYVESDCDCIGEIVYDLLEELIEKEEHGFLGMCGLTATDLRAFPIELPW